MENIQVLLDKANELGLMISSTRSAVHFREMEVLVEADREASLLMKKYNEFAEMIRVKQESGFEIESFEAEEFAQLTASVSSNNLLRNYIKARNYYMEMLIKINRELSI